MIRINYCKSKTTLKAAVLVSAFLLFAVATGFCQQQINLTAGPATTTLPDGTTLPMWGYSCGTAVATSAATCAPLSGSSSAAATGSLGGIYLLSGGSGYSSATPPAVSISAPTGTIPAGYTATTAQASATAIVSGGQVVGFILTSHGAGYVAAPTVTVAAPSSGTQATAAAAPAWSPVVITVPFVTKGASLTINLTNSLSFTPAGATTANAIPTSIVIVGQVGGGLGVPPILTTGSTAGTPTATQSPDHSNAQGCATWFIAANPPGTPCTSANNQGLATPPNQANRVQSMGAEVTTAAPAALTWSALKPGTYLLESGTHPSIQVPMGLIGMLVVTTPPTSSAAGTAYPAVGTQTSAAAQALVKTPVTYNAELPLEFSEIDPVQNKAVDVAVRTAGFSETMVWSGLPTSPQGTPGCGYPTSATYHQCYPPAVNYTPFYFLINGVAFDRANPAPSLFAATAGTSTVSPITGNLLVRLVNAGLRMHVPSIVGPQTAGFSGSGTAATVNGFTLIAEDGNPIPNLAAPRVKTEVFMPAAKTYDVMVNVPAIALGGTPPPALPIFDREGSLSANSSVRDAGMLAYLSVNGAALPIAQGTGAFAAATANPDIYPSVIPCSTGSCIPLVITDPSKGVIANDINVYGVALSTPPTNGTLTCTAVPGNPAPGICANGTFTYTPTAGMTTAVSITAFDTFGYCANGTAGSTSAVCTTVTLNVSSLSGNPTADNITYTSKMATFLKISSPGVLSVASDPSGLPLQVVVSSVTPSGVTINMDPQGGFTASLPANTAATSVSFTYIAQNSQGRQSGPATVTINFPEPSNLKVNVLDAQAYNNCSGDSTCISALIPFGDYRWIIEEDKTFFVDPNCTTNASTNGSTTTPGCSSFVGAGGTIPVFGVQFHTSNMDFVAQGCTGPMSCEGGQTMLDTAPACTSPGVPTGCSATGGQHVPAVCDLGNGACRPDPNAGTTLAGYTQVNPSQVHLDPSKRYYISVLPGDAANPFPANVGSLGACKGVEGTAGDPSCGHSMSGAPIQPACNVLLAGCTSTSTATFAAVNVLVLPTPLPTGKLSVLVFEDDFPLNGEQDGGGGAGGAIAPVEPGLGGFNLVLWDTFGSLGDGTGQNSNDEFNQPLSNSLAGTLDPSTGQDACPLTPNPLQATGAGGLIIGNGAGPAQATAMTGMIVTCPKYEADGTTLSPLAGQAVIANLMPEKFSVQAYPGADRIARGEEWLQTNTLDGQHPHDSFIEIGDPSYFQEYGPAGYHVMIGFANPAIINARQKDVCNGFGSPGAVGPCTNSIDGSVDVERLSRIPDERLYPSGSRDALAWTQCWVSLGDPDGEDFMFTKCDANGNFRFSNVPGGNWRLTIGDQWNDQIIDGLSTGANVGCTSTAPNQPINATTCPGGQALHMGNVGVQQWQSNLYTRTYIDDNRDGIWESNEIGIPFVYTMIHYRDGHNANALSTDFNGVANFNETFPLFNWYVVEADSTRYKTTGIHTVYDAGGPADGTTSCGSATNGARACGSSTAYNYFSNTFESVPLPADLSVPGAVYCATADCSGEAASFQAGTPIKSSSTASTGRIDPPYYFGGTEGFNGLTGTSNWIDIGKAPYAPCPPACATVPSAVSNPTTGGTTASTTMVGENGGIFGQVAYASTRPFDDASQMIQQPWEPNVPGVTINLYQEGFAADGVTPTRTLVDTTTTSSWDAWAQGFYPGYNDTTSGTPMSYMNCPGQAGSQSQDLFYFTLFDQPNYLDWYNSIHSGGTTPVTALPYNSQFKCYDSMKINNQLQPAPYDGKYFFPSSLGISPATGKPNITLTGGVGGNGPGTAGYTAASMAGTNCTICVKNPTVATKPSGDLSGYDPYRAGTPMLPPGKYVVEVLMPPGYEVYKEEDKNLLIGDNFIAPVTQQFGGLGTDVFIMPDQASVATMYDETGAGYNGTNYQNSTTGSGLADELSGVPGFPGFQDPVWPCVGEMRVVPDYLSLYPGAKETAPFAGATRPLCDRKEVTLSNQAAVNARFFVFTSTHIAAKFTGVITDDFTSEFDPFSPQFGEKFSPPNMPISTKDYLGNELSRVYSDHWGTYDGLTFSSWDVNPPNITGYSPSMMTQCMNDPGPITDTTVGSPTYGQKIADPLYNPAYSNFCYINPFMPGVTTYNDTPVVPTQGFVGAGYNNTDCSYPDATPAIAEVDGDGIGPWVSAAGKTLTITALGNQQVSNNAYSGPSANVVPFASKTINRHYGFGTTQGTGSVTIGGIKAAVTSWNDTQIVVTVPASVPACAIQQQSQYQKLTSGQSATALCGQVVITASNGKQSVDAVTVTIAGSTPTHVSVKQTIQSAIDAANPGDLIIVDPTCTTTGTTTTAACSAGALHAVPPTQSASTAAHNEMLLMWKPVRLQGVGAPSSIIDAGAFPAGKLLDPWRRHVNCLFGLTLSGVPIGSPIPSTTGGSPTPATYDSTNAYSCPDTSGGTGDVWSHFVGQPVGSVPQIDRIPLEAVVGWDATLNGNLAEQLQEPSLMGAYEGAGITVLGKGVNTNGQPSFGLEGAFPAGSQLLQNVAAALDETGAVIPASSAYCTTTVNRKAVELIPNPYPSNYECNPSSIDGLTIRDSTQGGGGVFVHGWNHNLQIANNRIYNNAGTLSGGITVGQGEFPDAITVTGVVGGVGEESSLDVLPSCQDSTVVGAHLPYCLDLNVNMHNNFITSNSSLGDELFSGTLAGGGGASFCTGSDYYKFNYNWVCGNVSSAEGGGITHLGFMYNGDIEHNTVALNESNNPTIPTNGGGIQIMGTPDTDPTCTTIPDADCPPGLSDGTGPNLVINANLIQANGASSGAGGGLRLQQVNGTDISSFPNGCILSNGTLGTCPRNGGTPAYTMWNSVSLTNNIIVNNIAGWDGAGISMQDSLNVSIINNTISSNDALATSGVLTQSIGTPVASAPAGSCVQPGPTGPTSASCPQSSGVTSTPNSGLLTTTFVGPASTITCPTGMSGCMGFSNPLLQNNLIWQNRSFYIGIGNPNPGLTNQQNQVTLFPAFSSTAAASQTAFGSCSTGFPSTSYWDVGVRGDMTVGGHESGFKLNPTYSVLGNNAGYSTTNLTSNPSIVSQYCNGGRVPPTCTVADGCGGPSGYGVPPGVVDAQAPNPVFTLTPAATVDEGNNWINVSWGPLSLSDDSVTGGANGNYGGGNAFGNYALNAGSPAIDYVPVSATNLPTATIPALALDFFGNKRPDAGNTAKFDVGAIEYVATVVPGTATVSPSPLAFGSLNDGTSTILNLTVTNTGASALAGGTFTFGGGTPQPFTRVTTGTFPAGAPNCGVGLAVGTSCTIKVQFAPTTAAAFTRTLTVAYGGGAVVTPTPVSLTGTGVGVGTLSFTSATHATLSTVLGTRTLTFTIPTPRAAVTSVVTITNTGNAPLTIGAETLATNVGGLYSITANTCTTALAPTTGTCTVSIRYATPTIRPTMPDVGLANFTNNGSGTTGGVTGLALSAR